MFTDKEALVLIEWSGPHPMVNGWSLVVRAEWTDATPQRPHGLSYALVLLDENGDRLLGFDNSHRFDGASDTDPFDHEHRSGRPGQAFEYRFVSPMGLLGDFFGRVEAYCAASGQPFAFEEEELP